MRLGDAPLFVDQVRDPARVFVFRRAGRSVGEPDLPIGVAEKGEGEFVFVGEARVRVDIIETDAEDLGVFRLVLIDEVPEPGTFRGSTWGVGLRKKPEHDFASAEFAQLPALAAMIDNIEVGRCIANVQHPCTSHE